jgi:hypothetical protein
VTSNSTGPGSGPAQAASQIERMAAPYGNDLGPFNLFGDRFRSIGPLKTSQERSAHYVPYDRRQFAHVRALGEDVQASGWSLKSYACAARRPELRFCCAAESFG